MNKLQVLVVDDEWNTRNLIRIYLAKNSFEVTEAKNGHEGVELISQKRFDLIILDVMMPGMDGWEVCHKIREVTDIPILMLTARTDTKDKVKGLTLGADDYVVKPFDPDELIARVFALLRRASLSHTAAGQLGITYHDLTIDPEGRQVFVKDRPIDFTPKEFELLLLLAEQPRRAFERETLLEKVWGGDYFGDFRTVDTHVKNIRDKMKKANLSFNPIQTIWGVGYKFHWTDERT